MEKLEEKTFPFEIKALSDEGTFEGYAAIFGKPDAMNEIIEPEAFTKTLKEGKTRPMLWYHDPMQPLGMADLEVDAKGLKVLGTLNLEVQAAREKHALMKQKVIKGLSFGFQTIKDFWNDKTRILKEVKLYEVSPCTFQAHPKALISAVKDIQHKSFADVLKSLEGDVKIIEEFKVGKMVSSANLKLINNAVQALVAILKKLEPSDDTQDDKKGMYSSIIEALGEGPEGAGKPHTHLFGSTIKALENSNKEN